MNLRQADACAELMLNLIKKTLRAVLLVPVAVFLLFEEWGWKPLAKCFAALGRLQWWGQIERLIAGLSPRAALLAFGLPVLALVPVKLLALYLLGHGQVALGLAVVVLAKLSGTALTARLFQLTHPALMQMSWFARLYTPWKIWKDRVLAQVRNSGPWRLAGRVKAGVTAPVKALSARFIKLCKSNFFKWWTQL